MSVGIFLQPLLQLGVDGQHGRGAEGVAGMHAHGSTFSMKQTVIIWFLASRTTSSSSSSQPRTDSSTRTWPTRLAASPRAAITRSSSRLYKAPAGAAHGVGRPDHHRVAQLVGDDFLGLLHVGPRRCGASRCPGGSMVSLKARRSSPRLMASTSTPMTLTPYWSRAPPGQLRGQVQARLAAQIGQQGVRPLLGDDFGQLWGG
jgi:hypothetical protein